MLRRWRNNLAGWKQEQVPPCGKIALICHDAYHHGAQYLSLNLARSLSAIGYEVHTFLLGGGPLKSAFEEVGYLHDLSGHDPQGPLARKLAAELRALGPRSVICNTPVSAIILPVFKKYLRLLERGGIAFTPKALNDHRRHAGSVTIGNANHRHYDEIVAVQADTIARHELGKRQWSERKHMPRMLRSISAWKWTHRQGHGVNRLRAEDRPG